MCALAALVTCVWVIGLNVVAEEKRDAGDRDQKFATTAAAAGMAEVKAGNIAMDKATSDDVKKFGEHMVRDHSKANQELTAIMKRANIDVPREMSEKDRTAIDNLNKQNGADFDRAYIKQQLAAHKDAVALFEDEAKNGKNEELRAFAEKTLPTLREHLKHVTQLAGGDRPSK